MSREKSFMKNKHYGLTILPTVLLSTELQKNAKIVANFPPSQVVVQEHH